MMKLTSIKNTLITCTLLFFVIPAVDGGVTENYFARLDKAPLNKHVKQFVKTYIRENRNNLYSIKQRSSSPFIMIDSVFNHFGLPVQLKYLAVVESELKTKAVSKVGAVGPWQLMPKTARILGLKVNKHHDDRKNYYKSTMAAARYLKDLHEEFGDWFLVFAAYNGGEGPVYSAIKKSGSRNYWTLQNYLPEETREYVKKYIATCYYFEGTYNPALLSKTKGSPYSNSSKTLKVFQSVKITAKEMPQVKDETSEERFNRILKESEESLQRSNQTLQKNK
ncbi:MAG TPA: lytic transglycosylase domain-containing protein [Puia sp.]|jgi:membrane-bound lytic murein transglycosylase D|nr:lytic transglycosylase domain-containing protein [Puia sp.]